MISRMKKTIKFNYSMLLENYVQVGAPYSPIVTVSYENINNAPISVVLLNQSNFQYFVADPAIYS